jgi:hypothetical protein
MFNPLAIAADFNLVNSSFMACNMAPLQKSKIFVVHPPLVFAGDKEEQLEAAEPMLKMVDVTCINYGQGKGGSRIAALMNAPTNWTYRVLPSWGKRDPSSALYEAAIRESKAFLDGRVEFLDYTPQMSNVFKATKVVIIPSFREGYSYTSIEALRYGCQVVRTDYPTIDEAVGDVSRVVSNSLGKLEQGTLEELVMRIATPDGNMGKLLQSAVQLARYEPQHVPNTIPKWVQAITQALQHPQSSESVRQRFQFLEKRQNEEINQLVNFLQHL